MPVFIRCSIWKMNIELGAAGLVSLDQFAQSMNIFNRCEIPSFAGGVVLLRKFFCSPEKKEP